MKSVRNIFLTISFVLVIFFFANSAISIIITEKSKKGISGVSKELSFDYVEEKTTKKTADLEIELGKKLFFDPILSKTGTVSCASCHKPDHGFSDDKPVSIGINDQKGDRNTPTVFNTSHLKFLFWDGRAKSLEEQALGPIQNPKEMGETIAGVLTKLNKDPVYVKQFQNAFGRKSIAVLHLALAITAFERTLISTDSDYDRFLSGDSMALSESANRGLALFNGKAMCIACHKGPDFTDGDFHNIGLPITDDVGRSKISVTSKDTRKFKTPTLREVANTAPYFHSGQFETLEQVIAFYNAGGGVDTYKDPLKKPLNLNEQEQKDLIEFLKALSGRQVEAL
ncbi:MAG: c-type cytochrome [Candidatus Melainabacteria bacterium]|nr:c-type cytochrome [Candidatus Melainabacteria bacterium]